MTKEELKTMVEHYGKDKTLELMRMTLNAQDETMKHLARRNDEQPR